MTPAAYKEACAPAHVMRRTVLEATAEVLRPEYRLAATLARRQCWAPVVAKPPRHTGGSETDWLVLSLEPAEVGEIVESLIALILRCHVEGEAYRHEAARLDALLDAWQEWWFALGVPSSGPSGDEEASSTRGERA
jgi:hypothetical protein